VEAEWRYRLVEKLVDRVLNNVLKAH